MKQIRFLTFVLVVGTLILSACGATPSTATPAVESTAQKVEAMPVAFVGIVDSMAGDQWVISGTTVTVDESIVRDGPFHVGDRIKVEGFTEPDGSFTVSRVEAPTPQEVATLPPVSVDNSNDAISNANTNDVNDDNSNAANSNVNDDHGTDVNSNDDNSNSANTNDASTNVNDDNGGGNSNSSVDNSNTANSNDDNSGGGGNSNDNKGSGSNSNDDNGGGNSNDANANGNGG